MGKIKRNLLAAFLNTSGNSSEVYHLIGEGVTSMTIAYNPQTTEETYIHQDSGSTEVESYRPNAPVPMTAIKGDPIFEFVDDIRKKRKVLDDAKTDIVLVYLYEPDVSGAYPAEKSRCSIQIDDFGGDGGASSVINFTINFIGDPVEGTFNPATKTFTANANPTYLVTFSVSGTASARLADAQIVVNNKTLFTDATGIANIQLPAGTYAYTVIAAGYTNKSGSVTVTSSAKFEAVSMTAG